MRLASDEALRQRFGSVLESRDFLRHPATDEVCIRWCEVCKGAMRTLGDAATHEKRHADEGLLIPVAATASMYVGFWTPEQLAERRGTHWRFAVLTPDGVDWRSNLPRPICECGAYAYISGGMWRHNHEPADGHAVSIVGGVSR